MEGSDVTIVPIMACVMEQICQINDKLPQDGTMTKFHARRAPSISIKDYLTRIAKYGSCSSECFVLALVYIDRIIKSNQTAFVVNSLSIHRLLITSVMVAAKFFDDQYFNNSYYAKVGGLSTEEINRLEVDFLFMNGFSLSVTTEIFRQYHNELANHPYNSACECVAQRGKIVAPTFPVEDAVARCHDVILESEGDWVFLGAEEGDGEGGGPSAGKTENQNQGVGPKGWYEDNMLGVGEYAGGGGDEGARGEEFSRTKTFGFPSFTTDYSDYPYTPAEQCSPFTTSAPHGAAAIAF
jgi:hypothetical protein